MKKFLAAVVFLLIGSTGVAQVPKTISYQGILTDISGAPAADGSYNITFKLYDSESGEQPVWEESQELILSSGLFNAILGQVNSLNLPFNKIYWLGISINGSDELTPRTQLSASPYSLNSLSLSDSIVTGSKIAEGQVVRSVNSLTDDVQIVAGENISVNVQSNLIEIASQGNGPSSLPFEGEVETLGSAFDVLNTGSGSAASFRSSGEDRVNAVLQVIGEGNGNIMNAISLGKGGSAFFEVSDSENQNPVITGNNHGLGFTASFTSFNQQSESPILYLHQRGLGSGIQAVNQNKDNSFPLMDLSNSGIGPGLRIRHFGSSGNIAEFIALGQEQLTIDRDGNLNTKGSVTVGSKIIFPDGSEQSSAGSGTGQYWNLSGNTGTDPDTNFIGTIDYQPFAIKVNNTRALRIEPVGQGEGFTLNLIGGHGNSVNTGVRGATISGGGFTTDGNRVTGDLGVIGGGSSNLAGLVSTVSGGSSNSASANFSTVSGGSQNSAGGEHSSVSGGKLNKAGDSFTSVGGGESNEATGNHSTVSGGRENKAVDFYSTVSGGRNNVAQSVETGAATVGGGQLNQALNDAATVSGGQNNTASGSQSTISGGSNNKADGQHSSIAGGTRNIAEGNNSAIGGGDDNIASGQNSTVPGGDRNHARGDFSFAAGFEARAIHDGSFVWNDRSIVNGNDSLLSTTENQFLVRAVGGVQFKTNNFAIQNSSNNSLFVVDLNGNATLAGTLVEQSDRNAKMNFSPVNPKEILKKISTLPISAWSYIDDPGVKHIGPMAQDFKAAFGVGADETTISVIDRDGIAFAAIKGLLQLFRDKEKEIKELKQNVSILEEKISRLEENAHAKFSVIKTNK